MLAKDPKNKDRLDTVMHNLAECLRIVSGLITPFMHTTSKEIRKQLGIWFAEVEWQDAFTFDMMAGEKVKKGNAIFPRLDIEKELAELEAMTEREASSEEEKAEGSIVMENKPLELKPEIEFGDFDKIDFRVGTIMEAEKHPKADKLLVFKIKMGTEIRQVISGVAESFKPEEAVGRQVIVVANLKPRALRGLESKGMLLFADNGDRCEFVTTIAPDGEVVS